MGDQSWMVFQGKIRERAQEVGNKYQPSKADRKL